MGLIDIACLRFPSHPAPVKTLWLWRRYRPGWIVRKGRHFYKIVKQVGWHRYAVVPYHPVARLN